MPIKRRSILLISLLTIFIDQLSKSFVISRIPYYMPKVILPSLIEIRITRNTGAAFSILSDATLFLSLISLLASICLLIYVYKYSSNSNLHNLGVALLLGGTIGNGLDRWSLGYVIDFINILPINFPIFNFADIAINLSILCFLIDIFKRRKITKG